MAARAVSSGRPRIWAAIASPGMAWWVKMVSIGLAILGLLVVVHALPIGPAIEALMDWVERLGVFGPLVFVAVYFLATVLMLPAWPLSVAAGMLFGLVGGALTVLIGATLGMGGAFLVARYAARGLVERRLRRYPRFAAVDRAVGENGWKIVALLRLSPAVPFNLQNYLYGLTAIRFWPCILTSAAAILPGTFLYVYLGYVGRASLAAVGGAEVERGPGQWILLIVGLLATGAVTIYVTRLARRAIREQTQLEHETSQEQPQAAQESRTVTNSWIGAGIAAAVAAAALLAAAYAQLRPERLQELFGPPAVVMVEAYERRDDGPRFDHSAFDALLKQYVNDNGGVDYRGLQANPAALLAYNASLAEAPFDEMGRDQKLALLINAYNSFTLQLMIEWLGQEGVNGMRDIPADKRWEDPRWNMGGHVWTLNQIEHEQIRPKFIEPDIHWALVCAAVGCPPLRREAYAAERLDAQLRDQAAIVHADGSRWFSYDRQAGVAHLTPLYQWYAGDFRQVAGAVLDYAAQYAPTLHEDLQGGRRPRIAWLDYDWAVNDQENLP